MNEEDIEKISKYVASLDGKQLANLQQLLADTMQRVEKNKDRPLTESEVKAISMHEIAHEAFKDERTYNVATDFAINDILTKDEPKHEDNKRQYNRGEYIYRGGNDDVVRKAGCDKHKFEKWLADCPVTIYKREDCAYGWVEMHFIIDDEREED